MCALCSLASMNLAVEVVTKSLHAATPAALRVDVEQLDFKHEVSVWRDDATSSSRAVAKIGCDIELGLLSHRHLLC